MPRPRPLVVGFLAGLSVVAGCGDTSNVGQSAVASDATSTASAPHLSDAISESDVASILKAIVVRRVNADIDGVARGFTKVAVVDTFGAEGPYGNIEFTAPLGQLTAPQRRAVLDALAPREVEFISPAEFAERPWADDGGSAERRVASIVEVERLVELAEPRFKALVLMATYTALQLGELSALTRGNLDLDKATVTVVASASELANGTQILGDPKSYAGRRTVSIPAAIIPALADHLEQFAEPEPDGVVFVGPKGGPLRRGNFNTTWHSLACEADLEGLRFHDLRHTGNTLAAMTGASTKELMVRMGHSSARAALGYQHATEERERLIASKLSDMITSARS